MEEIFIGKAISKIIISKINTLTNAILASQYKFNLKDHF